MEPSVVFMWRVSEHPLPVSRMESSLPVSPLERRDVANKLSEGASPHGLTVPTPTNAPRS